MALRAGGSAPNITAFVLRESVALVSGQCGVPQWPGTTRLSRGILQQRGHVPPPVAALGGNGTSPLDPVRCSVVSASGQGGVPPCPRTTRLSRGVRGSCGTRPLRPPASLLHNAALPSVSASQSQAPFVAATASRPLGEGNRLYAKLPSLGTVAQPSALPGRWHALRAAVCAPLWLSWRCGISQALRALCLVSGLRPVVWCVPRPTLVLRRCAASALRAGLPVRPPWGLPQPARLLG